MRVILPRRPRFVFSPARFASFLRRVYRQIPPRDQRLLAGLGGIAIVAMTLLFGQRLLAGDSLSRRSTFTEGLVASSLADVDPTVQSLTHSALLSSDDHGNPTGQLAESWRISDDAMNFEFTLRPRVDRQAVLAALNPATPSSPFASTKVEPFDDRGVRITLTQPLAPFIAEFSKPIVPLGPYIIAERTKDHVTLMSRPDYLFGQPKLETIQLKIFPAETELQSALEDQTVDAVANVTDGLKLPSSMTQYTLSLPRTTAAFFNLGRAGVSPLATRQQLIDRQRFEQPLSLTVVTTETLAVAGDVQQLLTDWRAANVDVKLMTLNALQLRQRIASRDYDVLINGIDSGADPDPYPFWHSSQRKASGLNLTNFANVDADKVLEAARSTGQADRRAKLLDQFSQILDAQKPWLVLNHAPLTFAVDRDLTGPLNHAGFTPTDRYANVQAWQWK